MSSPPKSKTTDSEKALNAEASIWARTTLREFYTSSDDAYEPRTASDVLHYLDSLDSRPSAWRRLERSEKASFDKRYALARTALETLAKQRLVVTGSTINARGRDGSTTFARPRDASGDWSIELENATQIARNRVTDAFREWLRLEGGAALEGVDRVVLVRKRRAR